MSRLKAINAGNHNSSDRISAEIENIIRYINAAELGDNTISELLSVLFNTDGEFDGPIELQYDSSDGIQYRVGEYEEGAGWITLAAPSELKGADGNSVGTVTAPLMYGRVEFVGDGATAEFGLANSTTDHVLAYINGILQDEADYVVDDVNNTVTFNTPPANLDKVSMMKIRTELVSTFRRATATSATGQAVFAMPHDEGEEVVVYRNGLLQIYGGSNDYTADPTTDTVTFMTSLPAGDLITFVVVDNVDAQEIGGLMLTDQYTDENGYIEYGNLVILDEEVPQAKISGLVAALNNTRHISFGPSEPEGALTAWLWVDTTTSPNILKFYDGSVWIATSPTSSLPTFTNENATQVIRVNASGTGFELASVDLTSVMPKTYRGAANGVASLDPDGYIPIEQIPALYNTSTLNFSVDGTATDQDYYIGSYYLETVRLDGISTDLTSGTCTVQLVVDGEVVGDPYSVSSVRSDNPFGSSIEIDSLSQSRQLALRVSSSSTPVELTVAIAVSSEII